MLVGRTSPAAPCYPAPPPRTCRWLRRDQRQGGHRHGESRLRRGRRTRPTPSTAWPCASRRPGLRGPPLHGRHRTVLAADVADRLHPRARARYDVRAEMQGTSPASIRVPTPGRRPAAPSPATWPSRPPIRPAGAGPAASGCAPTSRAAPPTRPSPTGFDDFLVSQRRAAGPPPATARLAWAQTAGRLAWRHGYLHRAACRRPGAFWTFSDRGTSTTGAPGRARYPLRARCTVVLHRVERRAGPRPGHHQVAVVGPPAADFSASQQTGTLTETFTDTSTGGPTAWSWAFGDGATSTQRNPSHTYAAAGSYSVVLVASNVGGILEPHPDRQRGARHGLHHLRPGRLRPGRTDGWGGADTGGAYTLTGTGRRLRRGRRGGRHAGRQEQHPAAPPATRRLRPGRCDRLRRRPRRGCPYSSSARYVYGVVRHAAANAEYACALRF